MNVNLIHLILLIIKKISKWKSTGTFNYVIGTNMIAVKNASGELPEIRAYDELYVYYMFFSTR